MQKLKLEWMLERGHNIQENIELLQLLDNNNINSILIRTGSIFPDPWLIASHYASITKNLKFLIAVNPVMINPVYCALKIITFQKIYGNRISINLVSGASKVEQNIFGDSTSIDLRYQRTGEFAQIIKQLVTTGNIEKFEGKFYNIINAEMDKGENFEIVFAGSSDNTINLANTFGSAHYYAMESSLQYAQNRNKILVDSAIKATIIVEDSSKKAWDMANYLLSLSTEERIEELKKDLSSHESENQKRQQALHNFSKDNLLIEKNIWSGLGLLRGGGITSMVGDYQEVAELIEKFYNAGLNRLLLGGTPEFYYANNFINGVIPILKQKEII